MIKAKAEGNTVTINIHDEIDKRYWKPSNREEGYVGDVEDLQKILNDNKNAAIVDVYINSPGGSVSEGIAIYNILKRTRAYVRVFIDGFACSIASVIAMAGNSISMPKSSMQMIHNAWTIAMGNASELRKAADDMDKINEAVVSAYMSKFNGTEEELRSLLDNETYLTADECLKYGLCTKVIDDNDNTEKEVEEGIDQNKTLLENKLAQLVSIKNAIKNLDVEAVPSKTANEANAEVINEGVAAIEAGRIKEANSKNIKDKVKQVQNNQLAAFFNVRPEKEGKKEK